MNNLTSVGVVTEKDNSGNVMPSQIVWKDGRRFNIERVLHTFYPEDGITSYTVVVGNRQKMLIKQNERWYVNSIHN